MVDWCSHLIDHSGKFIALKGVFPSEELESLPEGVKFEDKISLVVPELDAQRHLIILSKD
jgi:16S rRNA (guanine527-N7)-methyltransferase